MNLVNLTPRYVFVYYEGEVIATLEPSGIARVKVSEQIIGEINISGMKIPLITQTIEGVVTGPPQPEDGAYCITYNNIKGKEN